MFPAFGESLEFHPVKQKATKRSFFFAARVAILYLFGWKVQRPRNFTHTVAQIRESHSFSFDSRFTCSYTFSRNFEPLSTIVRLQKNFFSFHFCDFFFPRADFTLNTRSRKSEMAFTLKKKQHYRTLNGSVDGQRERTRLALDTNTRLWWSKLL